MKTLELENYGLVELSADEATQVEGGSLIAGLIAFGVGVLIGYFVTKWSN